VCIKAAECRLPTFKEAGGGRRHDRELQEWCNLLSRKQTHLNVEAGGGWMHCPTGEPPGHRYESGPAREILSCMDLLLLLLLLLLHQPLSRPVPPVCHCFQPSVDLFQGSTRRNLGGWVELDRSRCRQGTELRGSWSLAVVDCW
jgi:hypothetical protein